LTKLSSYEIFNIVLPPSLTGCRATIIMLAGRRFPTGAHKVGVTYGCLAPALVTGQFDPRKTKAILLTINRLTPLLCRIEMPLPIRYNNN